MSFITALLSSIQFLSRLPIHKFADLNETPDFKASSYTYGMAGMFIALPAAFVLSLTLWVGLSPLISAILTIAIGIVVSGALHEDGLADVADGFWGGHTIERKLAIMRDSAIGTYGVLALILSIALRVALLTTLIETSGQWACATLIAIGGISRFSMLWPWSALPQARSGRSTENDNTRKHTESLAAQYGAPDSADFNKSVFYVAPALVVLAIALPTLSSITALAIGAVAVGSISALSRLHIKGHTGDTLGATQQFCEIGLYLGACLAI